MTEANTADEASLGARIHASIGPVEGSKHAPTSYWLRLVCRNLNPLKYSFAHSRVPTNAYVTPTAVSIQMLPAYETGTQ